LGILDQQWSLKAGGGSFRSEVRSISFRMERRQDLAVEKVEMEEAKESLAVQ
jgi:hypothetical protein